MRALDSNEWRPVLEYPDYEVSQGGQVRRVTAGRGARAGRVLRPYITRSGYRQVVLRRGGRSVSRLVCQLVCEAFHGPRQAGMEVRHMDGNSQNDDVCNLQWGTHLENVRDTVRHGTHPNLAKTHCKNGHEFTAENTAARANGGRRCRTCRAASSRRRKSRMHEERNNA